MNIMSSVSKKSRTIKMLKNLVSMASVEVKTFVNGVRSALIESNWTTHSWDAHP